MNSAKKTIGWCDKTWNPITGCRNNCWYCYARRMWSRFNPKESYRKIVFHPNRFEEPFKLKRPSRIFVGSMTDIFAPWVSEDLRKPIFDIINRCPRHTFQFLTRWPGNYNRFFRPNCWRGLTITGIESNQFDLMDALVANSKINISFISFEPLLAKPRILKAWRNHPDWLVIGAMTGPGSKQHQPKYEWIESILLYADKVKIPVFMKDNLKSAWPGKLRKEFPA